MKSTFATSLILLSVLLILDQVASKKKKPKFIKPSTEIYKRIERLFENKRVDLMFIMHSSESVGQDDFEKAKKATKDMLKIANNFSTISATGTRVALMKFSDPNLTKLMFKFGDYNDYSSNKAAILAQEFDNGEQTATEKALKKAYKVYEDINKRIKKPKRYKVIWMCMNSDHDTGNDPTIVADLLKNNLGVKICVIDIGTDKSEEAKEIASKFCYSHFKTFKAYKNTMKEAARHI